MPFDTLGLIPSLVQAANQRGYEHPTPIQTEAIPAILRGADVLASAQTGSGKTVAFCLPLLQSLAQARQLTPRPTRALILVPTRELAAQVGEVMHALAQSLPQTLRISVVFGGVSINPQMMALRGGADIVIATPGRLLDLLEHNALSLSKIASLVLDEADRLLDLGFEEEISRVLAALPAKRQSLLFSATFPESVQKLADKILSEPCKITIDASPANRPDIEQRAILVDTAKRTPLLRHLIKENDWKSLLIFVASKYAAEHVADKLRRTGIDAAALHGELSQGTRNQTLAEFKAGKLQVLVATDLASRGIDVAQLPVVINYDLPRSSDDYTHRIGRTGRASASGVAISFFDLNNEAHLHLIEKRQGIKIIREQIPGFEPLEAAGTEPKTAGVAPSKLLSQPVSDPNGGIKGKRKSKKDKLREQAALNATKS